MTESTCDSTAAARDDCLGTLCPPPLQIPVLLLLLMLPLPLLLYAQAGDGELDELCPNEIVNAVGREPQFFTRENLLPGVSRWLYIPPFTVNQKAKPKRYK